MMPTSTKSGSCCSRESNASTRQPCCALLPVKCPMARNHLGAKLAKGVLRALRLWITSTVPVRVTNSHGARLVGAAKELNPMRQTSRSGEQRPISCVTMPPGKNNSSCH